MKREKIYNIGEIYEKKYTKITKPKINFYIKHSLPTIEDDYYDSLELLFSVDL